MTTDISENHAIKLFAYSTPWDLNEPQSPVLLIAS